MKQLIFLFLTLFLASPVFGQKYLTADIRTKADSILRTFIGDTIFYKHCKYDPHTYYEYKNILGKSKWETLNKFKKTKGKFVKVDMRWQLIIPYQICPEYDTIRGGTSFYLDSLLRPTEKPYLDFIPDFFWRKDSCHLMNKNNALAIAKRQNLKTGIGSVRASIIYDVQIKTFYWEVSQTLWKKKDTYNNDYGEMDIVLIDATNGTVKSHETVEFGAIY